MAVDKKISALDPASALTGSEIVPIVQSGSTVRTTYGTMVSPLLPRDGSRAMTGDLNFAGNSIANLNILNAVSGIVLGQFTPTAAYFTDGVNKYAHYYVDHLQYITSGGSLDVNAGTQSAANVLTWPNASGTIATQEYGAAHYQALPTAYNVGNITGSVTLDRANGEWQNASATGDVTINITGGSDWSNLGLYLLASGGVRNFSIHASVKVSGDTSLIFPLALPSGTGARIRFEKHGSLWILMAIVKNIPTS